MNSDSLFPVGTPSDVETETHNFAFRQIVILKDMEPVIKTIPFMARKSLSNESQSLQ